MPAPNEILYRHPPVSSDLRPFNRLAVASLVAALVPMLFPAAIPLGLVARRQIRDSGGRERGSGLARAALCFALPLTVVLYGGMLLVAILPAVGG